MAKQSADKRLYRTQDAYLGGVCAGIAHRFDLDTIIVRIMAIVLVVATLGLGAIAYVVLWIILPQQTSSDMPCDVTPEQAESSAYGFMDLASPTLNARATASGDEKLPLISRIAVAVCLLLLFIMVTTSVSPMISGTSWWQFWPIGFVIMGLSLIVLPVYNRYATQWHASGIVLTAIALSCIPMSLGIMSWHTFALAFYQMWVLVALAVFLFVMGMKREYGALSVGGALLIAVFCLIMLTSYAVPGDVAHLLINMPNGRSLRIALSSAFLML